MRTTAYNLRIGSKTYVMGETIFTFGRPSTFLVLPMGIEPTTAILETAALTLELRKLGSRDTLLVKGVEFFHPG